MIADYGLDDTLHVALSNYWRAKGFQAMHTEAGAVPWPGGKKILCVNFLLAPFPSWHIPDEMIRLSVIYLVRCNLTKQFTTMQWAINLQKKAYGLEQDVVVAKYWCDEKKLRYLEKHRFPFFNSLRNMPLEKMITGRDFRGFDPEALLAELANRTNRTPDEPELV